MPGRFFASALILTGLLGSLACSNASGPIETATPTRLPTLTANPTPTATLLPSPSPTVNSSGATEPKPEQIASPAAPEAKQPATHAPKPTNRPVHSDPVTPAAIGSTEARTADPRLTQIVQKISVGVSEIRGLTFLEPLAPQLITRPELTEYLAATIDAEDQDELARLQELYWLLGLLDPSVELYDLFLDLLGEQIQGLFNLETGDLLVVAETLPSDTTGKLTMAHELVHALQQQRFDARRLVEESETNQDRELAMTALLEGDATVASGLYAAANLSMAEMLDLLPKAEDSEAQVFQSAPPVIQKTLLFPYQAGAEFVSSVQQAPGIWRQVNQIYSRPPVSTEQILHPAKYKSGENPIPVSLPPGGPVIQEDWELVTEDVLGEFLLRTYLESSLPRPQAVKAASGWGGDRFRLLRDDSGRRLFVAVIVWDTTIDAREFFEAYKEFTGRAQRWESHEEDESMAVWHTPGRSVLLELKDEITLIGIAPGQETLALIAKDFP